MEPIKQNSNLSKILVILIIIVVLIGSLFVVSKNIQKSPTVLTSVNSPLPSADQNNDNAIAQKEELLASNDVKSVDQIEADNLADDVALDPNQ